MNPYKILVIDDEKMIRDLLRDHFESEDYLVYTAENYDTAIRQLNHRPDIILLDISMPGIDGLSLCRNIRETVSCPILFLTAKVTELDTIMGFQAGGDDYITKPFRLKELSARVQAHLRRQERKHISGDIRFSNGLVIQYENRTVLYNNKEIPFSKREFDLVTFLARHPGQVFERDQIYESLWGLEADGSSEVVKEHIRKIRAKLSEVTGRDIIETVWGVGYKWQDS